MRPSDLVEPTARQLETILTPHPPPQSATLRENQKADVLMVQLYLTGAETIPDHVLCVHSTRPHPAQWTLTKHQKP